MTLAHSSFVYSSNKIILTEKLHRRHSLSKGTTDISKICAAVGTKS